MQRTIKIGQLEITTPFSYYWIIRGKIPLALAKELYESDVKKEIRVAGNCTAPKPELPWTTYYCPKTKKQLIDVQKLEEEISSANKLSDTFKNSVLKYLSTYLPVEDITIGDGFIETYHIDSEEAMNIFLKKCGEYGLLT